MVIVCRLKRNRTDVHLGLSLPGRLSWREHLGAFTRARDAAALGIKSTLYFMVVQWRRLTAEHLSLSLSPLPSEIYSVRLGVRYHDSLSSDEKERPLVEL